jgi:glycerol-3-phosphate acyltransferase PlsY
MGPVGFIVTAFFLGSIPFSAWLARLFGGVDLREVGSRNPGATNLLRAVGKGPALAALILDISKGAVPVILARLVDVGEVAVALTALAAIIGHVLSPFLGMRGGKGVATSFGVLLVLSPLATGVGLLVFLIVIAWKRYVSLASILAAATIAMFTLAGSNVENRGRVGAWATCAVSGIVLVRHSANARRLFEGREPKLGNGVEQT